jgi:hypothetical protein
MGVKSWGMLCLYIFLIVYGAIIALSLSFDFQRYIEGGLLIAAGILLIVNK